MVMQGFGVNLIVKGVYLHISISVISFSNIRTEHTNKLTTTRNAKEVRNVWGTGFAPASAYTGAYLLKYMGDLPKPEVHVIE